MLQSQLRLPDFFYRVHQEDIISAFHRYGSPFAISTRDIVAHMLAANATQLTTVWAVRMQAYEDDGEIIAHAIDQIALDTAQAWEDKYAGKGYDVSEFI